MLSRRSPAPRLFLAVALLNLFLMAVAGSWLLVSRRQHESLAVQGTGNLARSLAASLSGVLDKLDLGLFAVAGDVELAEGGFRGLELNQLLARQQKQIREFEGMWVADARGDIRWGTDLPPGGPVNIADREYFARIRSEPDPGLVLSKPVLGRVTKAWSILACRRINHPDGTFAGLVLGSVRVEDDFTGRFSSLDVGRGGRIVLRDGDFALVARYPPYPGESGRPGSRSMSAEALAKLARDPQSGTYQGIDPGDPVERISSYQRVPNYPYWVWVEKSRGETLAPWWLELAATLVTVCGFALVSTLYARNGWRRMRAKEQAGEKALATSEARFRAIVDNSHDGIIFADARGEILYRSPSFKQINGFEDEDRLGQLGFGMVHPDDLDSFMTIWNRMLANPDAHLEATYRTQHKDGSWRWVDSTVQNLLDNPDVRAVVLTSRDITGRQEAEENRRHLETQLNHLHRMESVGRLAGGISHDMNNVLAAIMGVTETLKHLDPGRARQLDLILDAALRGRNLLKGLMAFSRMEREEAEAIELNDLVQQQADLLASTTLQKIRVDLDLAEGLPTLAGSRTALATALMNLCVNAMDAMPEGGVLTLRTRAAEAGMVELVVEDTGSGMTPEVVARAMEPFFTTKPVGKGTGLGLSMVFATVQAHGGLLSIRSQPGQGTGIHLLLPWADTAPVAPGPAPATPGPRPSRILLVDDDQQVRQATRMMLTSQGHQVTDTGTGRDALGLAGDGADWDLAVIDMNMPGLNGLETLDRLREIRPRLPVLLATGYADDEVRRRLGALKGVALLTKPFSFQELQSALGTLR